MFMDLYYRLAETHKGDLMNQLYFRKQNNNILYHLVISLSSSFIMGSGLLWNNLTPACFRIEYLLYREYKARLGRYFFVEVSNKFSNILLGLM